MIKKFIGFYIRFVQKILISIFLTLLYFLAFGPTLVLMRLIPDKHFNRKLLKKTYWINSEGNDSDIMSSSEQS